MIKNSSSYGIKNILFFNKKNKLNLKLKIIGFIIKYNLNNINKKNIII